MSNAAMNFYPPQTVRETPAREEKGDPGKSMEMLLAHMLKIDASDLYITADSPPVFRVSGQGHPGKVPLDAPFIALMASSLMTAEQRTEFLRTHEMNLAVAQGEGRFRVNVFRQRGSVGMVVRLVRTKIKTLKELEYPKVMADISMSKRGLVLVVGSTGSGKSTALAAMIDHRNSTETGHIITIEDPLEFVHPHKKCVVTQREIGTDTVSYASALKNTLRQAPDVILIGEIRDAETMEAALTFAETGHLCISTLHANNANQALERIMNFFPSERHAEIGLQLSLNLKAVVSQRLIPKVTGGRAACLEVLLDTPRIKDLIKKRDIDSIKDAMRLSGVEGCRTFDGSLFDLYVEGKITAAEALKAADSPNNLRLDIERHKGTQGTPFDAPLKLLPQAPWKRR
jgi:twitching motility protein PilU